MQKRVRGHPQIAKEGLISDSQCLLQGGKLPNISFCVLFLPSNGHLFVASSSATIRMGPTILINMFGFPGDGFFLRSKSVSSNEINFLKSFPKSILLTILTVVDC